MRPEVVQHGTVGLQGRVLAGGYVFELKLGAVDGLVEGGRLAAQVDEKEDELFVAFAQEILSRDVEQIAVDFLNLDK